MQEEGRSATGRASPGRRLARFLREHPYAVGLVLASTLAGAAAGAALPIGDLSLARRCLGGAVAGFYFGLFPLGFRLFE